MSFKYDKKETYTQAELDALLTQHEGYFKKSHVAKEEFDELQTNLEALKDELTPYKQKDHDEKIRNLTKGLTSESKLEAAIKLANLTDDDDDETITSKVKKTIESYDFLKDNKLLPGEGVKTKNFKSLPDKEVEDQDFLTADEKAALQSK